MSTSSDLPTQEGLAKLSPRLLWAYAVRNAMRVFPLFKKWASVKNEPEHLKSVEDAIALVSRFASGAQAYSRETAANAATNVRKAGAVCDNVAANRAAAAAEAAAEAADMPRNDASVKRGDVTAASSCAARSAEEAVRATHSVYNGNTCAADEAVAACADAARSDFNKLADSKQTTVDVKESGHLGQLWPTRQPEWLFSWSWVRDRGQLMTLNGIAVKCQESRWRSPLLNNGHAWLSF